MTNRRQRDHPLGVIPIQYELTRQHAPNTMPAAPKGSRQSPQPDRSPLPLAMVWVKDQEFEHAPEGTKEHAASFPVLDTPWLAAIRKAVG